MSMMSATHHLHTGNLVQNSLKLCAGLFTLVQGNLQISNHQTSLINYLGRCVISNTVIKHVMLR